MNTPITHAIRYFERNADGTYGPAEFEQLIRAWRLGWEVPRDLDNQDFIEELLRATKLQRVSLKADKGRAITRYVWGEVSSYRLGLSLRPRSYCSHGTAAFLHNLLPVQLSQIYVNQEQSEKPPAPIRLTQAALDRAFSGRQRLSTYVYRVADLQFVLLAGKNTNRLGVESVKGPGGEEISATTAERTLIDITVRPAYAGGVRAVLGAFARAKPALDVERLVRMLRQINHRYPYRQAIGFYLERAGYRTSDLDLLLRPKPRLKFHLDYALRNPSYDDRWRIFHPQEMV